MTNNILIEGLKLDTHNLNLKFTTKSVDDHAVYCPMLSSVIDTLAHAS